MVQSPSDAMRLCCFQLLVDDHSAIGKADKEIRRGAADYQNKMAAPKTEPPYS